MSYIPGHGSTNIPHGAAGYGCSCTCHWGGIGTSICNCLCGYKQSQSYQIPQEIRIEQKVDLKPLIDRIDKLEKMNQQCIEANPIKEIEERFEEIERRLNSFFDWNAVLLKRIKILENIFKEIAKIGRENE